MKKVPFKVSARAARLIGRENVATSQGAVTELVKNAYDADAGACAIFFLRRHPSVPMTLSAEDYKGLSAVLKDIDRFYSDSGGTFELVDGLEDEDTAALAKGLDELVDLWIVDNGNGMSSTIIEDSWMVIGTDAKEVKAKSEGGRILTGAKGIGRFALDRLGQECELYSSEKASKEVVHWVVDWGDFEGEGKIIGDVTAVLETETRSYHDVLTEIGLEALLPTQMPARDDNVTELSFVHGTAIGIPLFEACMFWVFGIGHGLNEFFISGQAAHIFWWASARDVSQARIQVAKCGIGYLADLKPMFPAVAKVLDVAAAARAGVLDYFDQLCFVGWQAVTAEVRVWNAPCRALSLERAMMGVGPAHEPGPQTLWPNSNRRKLSS